MKILPKKNQVQTRRIAIFAHYDKLNQIDDYVIYYLQQLNKVTDSIIFISDCDLDQKELSKIDNLILDSISKKHGEYDFGSYKRGFDLLKSKYPNKLSNLDELLFVNDSCYCLEGFEKIFEDMEQIKCDMWSMTDNTGTIKKISPYHLQSFFLAFRKNMFSKEFFENFVFNIQKLNSKEEIIQKYEIGLSQLALEKKMILYSCFSEKKVQDFLEKNREKLGLEIIEMTKNKHKGKLTLRDINYSYIGNNFFRKDQYNYSHNDKFFALIAMGCPLLKIAVVKKVSNGELALTNFWFEALKLKIDPAIFDISLTKNHLKRIGENFKSPDLLISDSTKYFKSKFNMNMKIFLKKIREKIREKIKRALKL